MKKLNTQLIPILKATAQKLVTHRVSVLALVVLLLAGYTLLITRSLSNPLPDQQHLAAERAKAHSQQITLEDSLIERIERLTQPSVDVTPRNLGTTDPFNP